MLSATDLLVNEVIAKQLIDGPLPVAYLKVTFNTLEALRNAYLRYTLNGGLFLSSNKQFSKAFKPGDLVQLELIFPIRIKPYKACGQVVLFTPYDGIKTRWTPGIAIEFSLGENSRRLCQLIDKLLID